ncbi:MAG: InlB B-repeat-containing protein [Clostridia bacterium]|nr:InlB B-repeat-containing protein [Clostridia bacterium]
MKTLKTFKNIAILTLFSLLMLCISSLICIKVYAANFTVEDANVYVSNYISIKKGSTAKEIGIRYSLAMPKNNYDNLIEQTTAKNPLGLYSELSFGLIIIPEDYVNETPITAESLFGSLGEKAYYWGEEDLSLENQGLRRIILFQSDKLAQLKEFSKPVVGFYGSVINIKNGENETNTNNLTRNFTAISFISYKEVDSTITNYKFSEQLLYEEFKALKTKKIDSSFSITPAYLAYKEITNREEPPTDERKLLLQEEYLNRSDLKVSYVNDNDENIYSCYVPFASVITLIDTIPTPQLLANKDLMFETWLVDGKKFDFSKKLFNNVTLKAKYGDNSTFMRDLDDYETNYRDELIYDTNEKISGQEYTIGFNFEKNFATTKYVKIDTTSWNNYKQIKFSFRALNLDNYSYPHIKVLFGGETFTPIWDHLYYEVIITKEAENQFSFQVINTRKSIDKKIEKIDFSSEKYFYIVLGVEKSSVVQGFRLSQFTGYHEVIFNSNGGTSIDTAYVPHNKVLTEPTAPKRYGYVFKYWKYNGERYDFTKKITNNLNLEAYYEVDANASPVLIDFSKANSLNMVSATLKDETPVSLVSSSDLTYGTETKSLKVQVPVNVSVYTYLDSTIWEQCKEVSFYITHSSVGHSARFLCADLSKSIWDKNNTLGHYGCQLYRNSTVKWVKIRLVYKNSNGLFDMYYDNYLRAENIEIESTFPIYMYFSSSDATGCSSINYYISNVVAVPK